MAKPQGPPQALWRGTASQPHAMLPPCHSAPCLATPHALPPLACQHAIGMPSMLEPSSFSCLACCHITPSCRAINGSLDITPDPTYLQVLHVDMLPNAQASVRFVDVATAQSGKAGCQAMGGDALWLATNVGSGSVPCPRGRRLGDGKGLGDGLVWGKDRGLLPLTDMGALQLWSRSTARSLRARSCR